MSALARSIGAQVRAETASRLRSPGTFVAALALVILTFVWIPNPTSNAATITWTEGGEPTTALYSAAYLGVASAVLASCFLSLFGWYLVAGAVRRDRETGVGVILAATPLTRTGYLAGKFAAHWAYLLALSALALPSAALFFAWHGVGPISPIAIALPSILLIPPSMALVAALAILFDVVPGLRGRAGPVIWFFVWASLFVAIPTIASGALGTARGHAAWPLFDPTGVGTIRILIANAIPNAELNSISFGVLIRDEGYRRVAWPGIPLGGGLVLSRLTTLLTTIPLLGIATVLFDRFASPARPARRAGRARVAPRKRGAADATSESHDERGLGAPAARGGAPLGGVSSRETSESRAPGASAAAPSAPSAHREIRLPAPVAVDPSARRAIFAETWLAWRGAGLLRVPLLAAAVLGAVLPGSARPWATGALLFLLAPAISEVAAREALRGTRGLIQSQPGIPRSFVLWKTAATALLVLALGAPSVLRAAAGSPARGASILLGLLFFACFAAVSGTWTRSGKLFAGANTAMLYAAANKLGGVDYCGLFGPAPRLAVSTLYAAVGIGLVGLTVAIERRR